MQHLFRKLPILIFCALALSAPRAIAQRVYWEPEGGTLGIGKSNELRLVFENCSPQGSFNLPAVPGLEFGQASRATETSSTNFSSFVRRNIFAYRVQPQESGMIVIPEFQVETDKGTFTVAENRFNSTEATVGQTELKIDDVILSQVQTGKTTAWVGEVIDVEYLLLGSSRVRWERATIPVWAPDGFIVEPFQEPDQVQANMNNDRWWGYRHRARIQANEPGIFKIDPVQQAVNVQTGERSVFGMLSQPTIERFTVTSETPTITVLPLPEPVPADFSGAVGDLKIESKVVPEIARVGEPITWTLTLSGTGNWPSNLFLPEREISSAFEVVQPESRQEMEEGKLFSGSMTEDAVLIPTRPGTFEIGPVTYSIFNTTTGKFETNTIKPVTVTIEPAANNGLVSGQPPPAPQSTTATAPDADGEEATAAPPPLPPDLVSVGNLPRQPVDSPALGATPSSIRSLWWLLVAALPPALLWMALAWRHMLATDPARERRQARNTLLRDLRAIASANAKPTADNLHQWRASTRAMWGISQAAPPARALADAVSNSGDTNTADDWSKLWNEAEAFLFGSDAELKTDWVTRAIDAAQRSSIKSSQPPLPLKLRHWSPRAVLLLAVLFLSTAHDAAAAESPADIYEEGRFAEARELWTEELATNPKNWAAHNNIALTYAQENEWNRAVAHWTAAFLLNPSDESLRSNLRLGLSRNQGVDPLVRKLLAGNWADRTAARLSPGTWQTLYFSGGVIVAIGLITAVIALYARARSRAIRRTGIGLALAGAIVSTAALTAFDRYGLLAQPTAALTSTPTELRSIPTDLAEEQQTTPIAAGTVVVVQRSFLGWEQVLTGNGSVGWIRAEATTPFYQPARVAPASTAGSQSSRKNLASTLR